MASPRRSASREANMTPRIQSEIERLRTRVPDLVVSQDELWVLIPKHSLPAGWNETEVPIAIFFRPGWETAGFYGIYTKPGLQFFGQEPNNHTAAENVPFEGKWEVYSWDVDGWKPGVGGE